ncbi:MarR family winged helix-turn-helix transcriptional regulator [Spongisporangium articulatum]|uniref:MarR family winged helix-turn-helix transcriptional regulator n=1 Tax=Spongisporangium articulatum TaxID=3362603 RepID=A0ABW8AUA3_9ACTN
MQTGREGPLGEILEALRRYGTDSTRLAHAFSARNGLQAADLQALVAVMGAERSGEPLTPGALRQHLGLSSAGTSYVIDRLERAGHVRRVREHPTDSRVVHLRYTEEGMATGVAFFGPLGDRTQDVLSGFSPQEVEVVARFLTAIADTVHEHVQELTGDG